MRLLSHVVSIVIVLSASSTLLADYEYRYTEGEDFDRSDLAGLRDEGFTSWMAHPSHGRLAVFGRPAGGFLEYDVKALGAGQYYLYVRCLALGITRTHVLWDGKEIGMISHAQQGTALKWSDALGPLSGPGDHLLRLLGGEDSTQWPYIDVILLTNQPSYKPDDADQDFTSFTTPFPPLTVLQSGAAPITLAPAPPKSKTSTGDLQIKGVTLGPLGIGSSDLSVALNNAGPAADVAVSAKLVGPSGGTTTATARASLSANTAAEVKLQVPVSEAGKCRFTLRIEVAGQPAAETTWPLTVPSLAAVALDEYAYEMAVKTAHWTAAVAARADLLPELRARLVLSRADEAAPLSSREVPAAATMTESFDIAKLGLGRYRLTCTFLRAGAPVQTDTNEFIRYQAAPPEKWEPIVETKAVGDTIWVNGKPFFGREIYHAAADANTAGHGFNLVQASGGDPDPLPSIQTHLDLCEKVGIYATVALFNNRFFLADGKFNLAHIEQAATRFKDNPAVWAWDLIDEPDGQNIPPEEVQIAADLLRRVDGKHIVWVNLCNPTRATDYLASQDLWSFDYYPLPTLPPFSYRLWLDISDAKLAGRKAIGSVLQTFVEDVNRRRMPTPDELRCISYLHIIHGYKYLGYYSYYDGPPAGCLARDPVLWSYTRALNAEHLYLCDAILAPEPWQPVRVEPATDQVQAREKRVGDKWYVIAVSNSATPLSIKLHPSARGLRSRLLFETDAPAKPGSVIDCRLRPRASHVYELAK